MKPTKPKANKLDAQLGQALRRERVKANVKRSELCSLLNISQQQWSKYELGIDRVSATRLYQIARCLNKKMDDFFPADHS